MRNPNPNPNLDVALTSLTSLTSLTFQDLCIV